MIDSFPNIHPLVVHFPIALFLSAVFGDVVLLARLRAPWLDRAVTLAYAAAAVSSLAAAITGKIAEPAPEPLPAGTVAAIGAHSEWAFFSVILCFVVAFVRFDVFWRDRERESLRADRKRAAAVALGLVACAVLMRTAAYGGALVFRHGIGVSIDGERGKSP